MVDIGLDEVGEASLAVFVPLFDSQGNEGLVKPVDILNDYQVDNFSVS